MTQQIQIQVNGVERRAEIRDDLLLVDFLRDELGLTGAKVGCGYGICGACTISLNGEVIKSCIMLAAQADGCEIVTVEGIASKETLHPVQAALIEMNGLQCGYCTSGIVVSAVTLLHKNSEPSEQEIREGLAGNLCRCTGYTRIVKAVQKAAQVARDCRSD
jgi:aerobic-type carbon monoxide dehydrogenase small subunit (CoxS/CutS family)